MSPPCRQLLEWAALKTGEILFGSGRGHSAGQGIPCLTEAVLL